MSAPFPHRTGIGRRLLPILGLVAFLVLAAAGAGLLVAHSSVPAQSAAYERTEVRPAADEYSRTPPALRAVVGRFPF
jgi:hypothetical protein